jgi:hypothetical protein
MEPDREGDKVHGPDAGDGRTGAAAPRASSPAHWYRSVRAACPVVAVVAFGLDWAWIELLFKQASRAGTPGTGRVFLLRYFFYRLGGPSIYVYPWQGGVHLALQAVFLLALCIACLRPPRPRIRE